MSESEARPPAEVRLIPVGHQGRLRAAGRDQMPVRVFERGGDVLMLVVLLDADTGIDPPPVEPVLLEYSSGQGLVRMEGEARLEDRDLIRFRPSAPPEVLQRRDFVRIDASQPVRLSGEQGAELQTHAVDLSGGGMLLQGLEHFAEGEQLRFTLELGEGELPIEGTARVVRTVGDDQRGVIFEAIDSGERQRLIHFIFDRQRLERARTRGGARRKRRSS